MKGHSLGADDPTPLPSVRLYIIVIRRVQGYMVFINLRALGCSILSAAKVVENLCVTSMNLYQIQSRKTYLSKLGPDFDTHLEAIS